MYDTKTYFAFLYKASTWCTVLYKIRNMTYRKVSHLVRVFLKVSVSFTYGERLQPIPVATDEPSAGQTAVATGWGTVSSGSSSLSSQLQAVVIQIVSREECNEAYAAYGGITENMICAAVIGGGKDACQGDTGGPLVVDGALVGVVSWGVGCAEENYPRVYSNVARLRDFITEETGVS
jgi:trypsin